MRVVAPHTGGGCGSETHALYLSCPQSVFAAAGADDTEEALKTRLVTFAANRDAVASTFASIATTVDGNRDPEVVWGEIDAFLGS